MYLEPWAPIFWISLSDWMILDISKPDLQLFFLQKQEACNVTHQGLIEFGHCHYLQ